MAVLPIDSGRYGTEEMKRIFQEDTRLQKMLDVEAALSWALSEIGLLSRKDAEVIASRANTQTVKLERVKEIEQVIQHDIMAVVQALAEACGESGGLVHFGATSNDINDTATALQFKDAVEVLLNKTVKLERILIDLSKKHMSTLMIGRTHGQHAIPMVAGLKFAVWMMEINRHIERLLQCRERLLVGKMTGAVGTQAGFGPEGLQIQSLVMQKLGLKPVEVSTQIVQRDRYAELLCILALVASSLEKFATEIRELQRTEIGELAEPFDVKKQVGSSTMPHKANPMISERICGLAKLVRSFALPGLENVPNWQERDLTHSSNERFLIPAAFILLDYMLVLMNRVLSGLRVNEERMRVNLNLTQGLFMSESVMLVLTRKGMPRQHAHEKVRELSLKSAAEDKELMDLLLEDPDVRKTLTVEEIAAALKPENYLGTTQTQVQRAVEAAENTLRTLDVG